MVFDLDGVIYLGNFLLPGAIPTVKLLRRSGIGTYFVTNDATTSRKALANRLRRMGLDCRVDEVVNAAYSASASLKRTRRKGARMLVVGEEGLLRELASAGFSPFRVRSRKDYESLRRRRPRADAVVVGLDRSLTYWELAAALQALTAGAGLVACNLDSTWPCPRDGASRDRVPGPPARVRIREKPA